MAPKRHRSYTASFKLNVIFRAEIIGNRAAGREFAVDERCVRRWRSEKEEIKKMPHLKRARRGGKSNWPILEENLAQWVKEQRKKGLAISTIKLRLQAKLMARDMNLNNFQGGPCWCFRFMKRYQICVRSKTTVGQQLPADWQEKKCAFIEFVKDSIEKKKFLLSQVINMDETPLTFDCPPSRTIDQIGVKAVPVLTTGHEKTSFTCVLACAANGDKLKPLVIFKRKTLPKGDFPSDVIVSANEKGWMCESVMIEWLEKVWQRRKGSFFNSKGLLIMDSMRSHLLDSVKRRCEKLSADIAVIPAGLTKVLQPLDLCVNKCFKAEIRKRWESWMSEGLHSYTKSGKMRRASYEEVLKWVSSAWESVKTTAIISGFQEAGILTADDNSKIEVVEEDDDGLETNLSEDLLKLFNSATAANKKTT